MVRYTGNTIALSPPLIINKAQIDKIVDVKTMKNGHRSAVIDYGRVVEKTKPTKPFNKELKTELDDLSKGSGMFEPDDDLDK